MLTLTDAATEAIEGILGGPTIPEGAGVRIAAGPESDAATPGQGALSITVVSEPAESDRVIDERDARVFVDEPVAEYLDDKLLDAQVEDRQVSFLIGARRA